MLPSALFPLGGRGRGAEQRAASAPVSRGGTGADVGVSGLHSAVHAASKDGLSPSDHALGLCPVPTAGLGLPGVCSRRLIASCSRAWEWRSAPQAQNVHSPRLLKQCLAAEECFDSGI